MTRAIARFMIAGLLVFGGAACGKIGSQSPTFDGSSEAAFKASREAIEASLSEEDLAEFRAGMGALLLSKAMASQSEEDFRQSLDGKTAKDVIQFLHDVLPKE
jgi:hypothetical protein